MSHFKMSFLSEIDFFPSKERTKNTFLHAFAVCGQKSTFLSAKLIFSKFVKISHAK